MIALTERQSQIANMIADGYKNQEIAKELGLSFHTVKNHIHNIFDTMRVKSRLDIALHVINQRVNGSAAPKPGPSASKP